MLRPTTSLLMNPPQRVSELINTATASWNEDVIRQVFLPIDAEVILSIPLCTRSVDDFWVWSAKTRGAFSVKSAYRMVLHTKIMRENWLDEVEGS